MKQIILAATLGLVVAAGPASAKGLLRDDPTPNPWRPDCLPASEFALDGVRLWAPAEDVRAAWDEPAAIGADSYAHADRHFDFQVWKYPGIFVRIARNQRTGHDTAFNLETGSSAVSTPSGIHPGMGWGDLVALLGRAPREEPGRSGGSVTHSISRCPDPDMDTRAISVEGFPDTLHLEFDASGVLRRIEIWAGI
ncbi:MAG: hypothetical protein OEN55_08265 [Alphaproteobacteria bacterium]|nr:hypothetical protein [Alphaproteobacteria bacterium]